MLTKTGIETARKLSKQDILDGAKRRERIRVPELGGEIVIRPLTFGELAKLSTSAGVPLLPDGTPDMSKLDSNEVISKNFEFIKQVVSMGVVLENHEQLTLEDVDQLPGGVPGNLAISILEISGWAESEIAKKKDVT